MHQRSRTAPSPAPEERGGSSQTLQPLPSDLKLNVSKLLFSPSFCNKLGVSLLNPTVQSSSGWEQHFTASASERTA